MDAINAENIHAYLELLRSVYDEFEFDDHPEQIYNMDETGVPLEPKIVMAKGQKKIQCCTSGQKSQITVICCGSATGQILPPFIIFTAKQLNILWTNKVSGSRYAVSDKGWVDQQLLFYWLKEHFLQNAVSQCPLYQTATALTLSPTVFNSQRIMKLLFFAFLLTHDWGDCSLFGH